MHPTPPMLSGLPLLGNVLDLYRDRTALVRRGFLRFGPVFGLRIGRRPAAVLIGPELHQTFFEQTDKALSMDRPYQFIAACFGRVGFLAPPEVYNEHRPIIHLPFKASKTASHLRVMQTETEAFLAALPESGELVLNDAILEIVRNVAAHALMGKAFRDASGDFWEHYQVLSDALDPVLPEKLPFPKFIRRDRARRKLRALVQPLIEARRADPAGHDDFLSEFVNARMKDGEALSDDDVVSLVTAMVFAGHETTAGQATWTLVHLLRHPEYHARLRSEVEAVLAVGTEIDAATLARLTHAHWAVAETSRLCPSVSMMFRQANQDMLVGGFRIPAGWVVLTSPPVAQRLPELFPDPDRYDPYRFSPGRDEDHAHRFSIISFGGAIHKCTGVNFANWEMAIIAALWTRALDLELVTRDTVVVDDLGASRPSPTVVRYRKRRDVRTATGPVVGVTTAGCPFHGGQAIV